MKIGATIGLRRILVNFFFRSKRYISLCFGETIGQFTAVMRAVKNAGSSEQGCLY